MRTRLKTDQLIMHLSNQGMSFAIYFGSVVSLFSSWMIHNHIFHSPPIFASINFYCGLAYLLIGAALTRFPRLRTLMIVLLLLVGFIQLSLVNLYMTDNPFRAFWFPLYIIFLYLFIAPWAGLIAAGLSMISLFVFPRLFLGEPIANLHGEIVLGFLIMGMVVIGQLVSWKMQQANELIHNQMKSLQQLSQTDEMTGLLNRRGLYEEAHHIMEVHQRRRAPFIVAIMDIDYFKQINDNFGHQIGDRAIQKLAKLLQESVRASDLVIRLGGDEFVVLLVFTDYEGGRAWAKKFQNDLRSSEIKPDNNSILHFTVSIGMTRYRRDDQSLEDLLKEADAALYQAKEAGRNSVVFYHQQVQPISASTTAHC